MKMKSDVVLNQITFQVFAIMIKTEGFKNPKNQTQNQIEGSIKNLLKKEKEKKGRVTIWPCHLQ
jgi:hypothetical protein